MSPGVLILLLQLVVCADGNSERGPEKLVFAAIGDFGSGTILQEYISDAMATWARRANADFFITTGDNIYPSGVRSERSHSFNVLWNNMYSQPSLQKPWYITLGNHDVRHGRGIYQVRYSALNSRWNLPATYYEFTKHVGRKTVQFVMLDTSNIVGRKRGHMTQLRWLRKTLATSRADWIIVCGHHPIYSTGEHGISAALYRYVRPYLEHHRVALYIAGHDHNMEHIMVKRNSETERVVDYVISGGGGALPRKARNFNGLSKMRERNLHSSIMISKLGFATFELTETRLKVSFLDRLSRDYYIFTKGNPRS
ncbi:unnamed protein product [Owenia fusiformis]|uniref:Uncharacterized protein n=1 Tax=Owenia fusiformis TaxID=6347 RepID=A0A8J1XX24_OWEFU|nr:unnamed protein product [Owenia fusiformis]